MTFEDYARLTKLIERRRIPGDVSEAPVSQGYNHALALIQADLLRVFEGAP